MTALAARSAPEHSGTVSAWLFWIALYAACVLAGRLTTPGLPEALGFAAPAIAPAALAAWLLRRKSVQARRLAATAIAVVLMAGAMTGVVGQQREMAQRQAWPPQRRSEARSRHRNARPRC